MAKIFITNQGYEILIDDEDFNFIQSLSFSKHPNKDHFTISTPPYRGKKLHRIIAERAGIDCSDQIDHEEGNGFDLRREKLRPASNGQNRANSKLNENNTSGYRGVHWKKGKYGVGCWYAQINFEGKKIYLGRFHTKEEAAKAYDNAALRMFGSFAVLNFPRENK